MSNQEIVQCEDHAETVATFMCQHLVSSSRQGFHCATDLSTSWPDAWCDACQQALQKHGDWTDESEEEAGITLVCNICYENIRTRNQLPLEEAALTDLFHDSRTRLQTLNDKWMQKYDLNREHQYDYDLDSATLTLSRNQKVVAAAQIQIVGSFSEATQTWLWSWANEATPEIAYERLWRVKDYGDCHQLDKLSMATWNAIEDDGWRMTAAANEILGGVGAYRVRHAHLWIYFVLIDIGIVKPIAPPKPQAFT
jgi:hypothetical protein